MVTSATILNGRKHAVITMTNYSEIPTASPVNTQSVSFRSISLWICLTVVCFMAASFQQGSVIDFGVFGRICTLPIRIYAAIVGICVCLCDVYPYLSRILCFIVAMEQIDVSFDNCFSILAFSRKSHQVCICGGKCSRVADPSSFCKDSISACKATARAS